MKIKLFLLFLSIGICGYGQTDPISTEQNKTGFFDNTFDQYGNIHSMNSLQISKTKNNSNSKTAVTTISVGIFELYFENGCGMEPGVNATYDARRVVLLRVLQDLSDFINSPLKKPGNTTKVRIWVRNFANVDKTSSTVLGRGTAFYTVPKGNTSGFGGIVDNEVWKTIHTGVDSYTNLVAPLSITEITTNPSGLHYHGMVTFNFNNTPFNTNLTTEAPIGTFDLYSVILHEMTHVLGFASLIDANGQSIIQTASNYYSRYDTFLKNNTTTEFLITKSTTTSSSMYNYNFNPALSTSILSPNPSSCITNQTTCANAIKFVGSITTPVYTPNCFEGSSLSHFEDQCLAPSIDNYFVMSNGIKSTKRYLKPEEHNALVDMGYSLNTTYGNNNNAFGSYTNYGGTTSAGINVAGTNDGVNPDGTYSFANYTNIPIAISGILSNDTNAIGFEYLQDLYDSSATLSTTSGSSTTIVNFTSNVAGPHLLRYIPVNASGQKGNITYVHIYVANPLNTPNLIFDKNVDNIIFYPNPTKDILTILTKTVKINEVILVSITGQIVTTVNDLNSNSYSLDLIKYPKGTYIAIVKTDDGNEIEQKIIKN